MTPENKIKWIPNTESNVNLFMEYTIPLVFFIYLVLLPLFTLK